jgi:hypothetical protein
MSDQTLEARIRRLEDIEEIRRLKAAYCAACDDDHNSATVLAMFVPDGVWSNSMTGPCRGHAEIKVYFDRIRASGRMRHSTHMVTNPVIDVDGDEATGSWSFQMLYTGAADGVRHRLLGFYRERYVRVDGRWMYRYLFADVQDHVTIAATETHPGNTYAGE